MKMLYFSARLAGFLIKLVSESNPEDFHFLQATQMILVEKHHPMPFILFCF